jgi:hypothetical protein
MNQQPSWPPQQPSYERFQWGQQPPPQYSQQPHYPHGQYQPMAFKKTGSLQPLTNYGTPWEQPTQLPSTYSLPHQRYFIQHHIRIPYPAVVQPAPKPKETWYCSLLRICRGILMPINRYSSAKSDGKSVSLEEVNASSVVVFYSPGGFACLLRK